MRKRYNRIIAVGLSVILVTATISGCNKSDYQTTDIDISSMIDTERIIEDTTRSILESIEETPSVEDIINVSELMLVSDNWEDYIGDFETITYGLLANELKYRYDIFPAYVVLSDGTPVYGMGYTDYSTCYTNEDETDVVFEAGLLPYYGELDIPEADFNAGLDLYDIDFQTEGYGFLLSYESDEFTEHCVVYGKYLRYGVDAEGHIFYDAQEFDRDKCDESLGSLYSFDEQRYLLDTDIGDYMPISGISLSEEIDFDELEKEINAILDEQDFNLADIDIEESVYLAQEAVQSYLLSLQEETFLGCSVDYLVELAGELDPMECYRITNDGLMVVTIEEDPGNPASSLCKWLVGTACVIVTAVAIVGSMVCIECPALSAAAGAIAGIGIEIFMQVVDSGRAWDSLKWGDIALAAASGAISGYLGPYMMAKFSGAAYFLADAALDGLIGGIEKGVSAWIKGDSGENILKQFGYGVALGFGLSAGFKGIVSGVGKLLSKPASYIGKKISGLTEKIFPNLSKKVSKKISEIASDISKGIYKLKDAVDSGPFHSQYISNKIAWRQIERILEEGDDKLAKKAITEISKNEVLDVNDNVISKETLKELFNKASDGDIIGKIKVNGEVIDVIKKNGIVSVMFDSNKYQTVTLSGRLVADRDKNMLKATELYKKSWLEDPSKIPESIGKALKDNGLDLEDIDAEKLLSIIKKSTMVMHENADLMTITLVSKEIHSFKNGGVFHMGGFGLAKYLKEHMGTEFGDRLLSASSSVIANGA